jgi:phosphohistidine phosphatase
VMLVGHNPGLSQLAEWLTGEEVGHLPTAAVYAATSDLARWPDLDAGAFRRLHLDHPR